MGNNLLLHLLHFFITELQLRSGKIQVIYRADRYQMQMGMGHFQSHHTHADSFTRYHLANRTCNRPANNNTWLSSSSFISRK